MEATKLRTPSVIALLLLATACGDDDAEGAAPAKSSRHSGAGMDASLMDGSAMDASVRDAASDASVTAIDAGLQMHDASICGSGACGDTGVADAGTCSSCLEHEISWQILNSDASVPLDDTRFVASDCHSLTLHSSKATSCTMDLPRCSDSRASVEVLNAALANAEVQADIAAGGDVGVPAEHETMFAYEITVDGMKFVYRVGDSVGFRQWIDPKPGLEQLRATLDRISALARCDGTPAADCDSPYDPGSGDAGTTVYWHDSASQTCLRRRYGGQGGNRNRYATANNCELVCPVPLTDADCGQGRSLVQAILECSYEEGGGRETQRCVKRCKADRDCENEAFVGLSGSLSCDTSGGLCGPSSTFCL